VFAVFNLKLGNDKKITLIVGNIYIYIKNVKYPFIS